MADLQYMPALPEMETFGATDDPRYAIIPVDLSGISPGFSPAIDGTITTTDRRPNVYEPADLVRLAYGVYSITFGMSMAFTIHIAEEFGGGEIEGTISAEGVLASTASDEADLGQGVIRWQGTIEYTQVLDGVEEESVTAGVVRMFVATDKLSPEPAAIFDGAFFNPLIIMHFGTYTVRNIEVNNHDDPASGFVLAGTISGTLDGQAASLNVYVEESEVSTVSIESGSWSISREEYWPYDRNGGPTYNTTTGEQLKPHFP